MNCDNSKNCIDVVGTGYNEHAVRASQNRQPASRFDFV